MVSHNVSGMLLTLNYLFFVIFSIFTGNIKHYIPKLKGIYKRLIIQLRFYMLGIFISEEHPFKTSKQDKFNPMQQLTYLFIMFVMMPFIVVSGWLLMFPELAPEQFMGMGGVFPMAFAHTIAGFLLSLFMLGHIYLGTTGHSVTELFKSMLTGWHLEHEGDSAPPAEKIEKFSTRRAIKSFFPVIFYNPITIVGALLAIISFVLVIILIALEFITDETNPYMGIITFVVLPSVLLFGLLLIAWGAISENRRILLSDKKEKRLPVIDFNNPKHQLATIVFTVGSLIIGVMSVFGTFKAYEYTDSDEFCGEVCHTVMQPEYTAYKDSPHSRVGCVKCHIGSGAEWFVKAKISGAYQVYSVLFNKYSRPIPTPVQELRPATGTCEQCHWPKHFHSEKKIRKNYFLSDENNSEYSLRMLVKVGGGSLNEPESEGIHWVMNIANEISYLAIDEKRLVIPWVKSVSRLTGRETVYRDTSIKFDNALLRTDAVRKFDCIDCHNRPSHIYHDPRSVVNSRMNSRVIDPSIPYIKKVSVQTLESYVQSRETAFEDIHSNFTNFYSRYYKHIYNDMKPLIDTAIAEVHRIYMRNYFPDMKVSWKEYPNHINHMHSPGCFRCHDGKHVSDDGRVISNDCNVCHLIIYQKLPNEEPEESMNGLVFRHPGGVDKISDTKNCVDCHGAKPRKKELQKMTKK